MAAVSKRSRTPAGSARDVISHGRLSLEARMMLVPFSPTLSVAVPHRQLRVCLERHFKERLKR